MDPIAKYAAVFGRPPAVVRAPTDRWGVSACLFPPLKRGFWRSLVSESHDTAVYVTSGMSEHPMAPHAPAPYAARVELMAFSPMPIAGGPDGSEDVPTAVLQSISSYVLDHRILIGVGHTLDFQQPLASNTRMTGCLFATADAVDERRVRRCSKAQQLLNVVLLTAAELELARSEGVPALLDRFEAAGVGPVFDFQRPGTA